MQNTFHMELFAENWGGFDFQVVRHCARALLTWELGSRRRAFTARPQRVRIGKVEVKVERRSDVLHLSLGPPINAGGIFQHPASAGGCTPGFLVYRIVLCPPVGLFENASVVTYFEN